MWGIPLISGKKEAGRKCGGYPSYLMTKRGLTLRLVRKEAGNPKPLIQKNTPSVSLRQLARRIITTTIPTTVIIYPQSRTSKAIRRCSAEPLLACHCTMDIDRSQPILIHIPTPVHTRPRLPWRTSRPATVPQRRCQMAPCTPARTPRERTLVRRTAAPPAQRQPLKSTHAWRRHAWQRHDVMHGVVMASPARISSRSIPIRTRARRVQCGSDPVLPVPILFQSLYPRLPQD